ncbi:TIGR03085 family metal-binding protein [Pseudonocardia sp. TRM90224]|uniref:TIGR03085 family metal-binding protein n=1 Tax=Pseudonocardia sp. TRM90224 TaxID=2812678 RepID=UPI001E28380F|nr:TIGR03085 family metal-binding protein [Pseudonocardia sp. TRM90224]
MNLAGAERAAICDTFEKVGPEQPTLCGEWNTHDLLAHLLVRERQPWASGGIMVPFLAFLTDHAMRGYATTPWAEMIGKLRAGAPVWSPFAIGKVDVLANTAEFYVHHEDVRRGVPGWEPREPDAARDEELWSLVLRSARMMYRNSPVGIVLRRPGGEEHVVHTGKGVVTLTGEPGELLLHAYGRDEVRIDVMGAESDKDALAKTSRGI